jgi:hypothetical protein
MSFLKPTLSATRQRTDAEFVLKNPDIALAAIRRPTSLRSRTKRSNMDGQRAEADWRAREYGTEK